MLLSADRSQLLVVDIQERLMPAMANPETVIDKTNLLISAARRLAVPVTASAQYPKGLGPVVPEIATHLSEDEVFDKLAFSCAADAALAVRVQGGQRPQLVVCGVESHVCVLQTALEFSGLGMEVSVVMDACSSRNPDNWALAGHRFRQNGVQTVSAEMVCFEWLGQAGTDAFRELSRLIK